MEKSSKIEERDSFIRKQCIHPSSDFVCLWGPCGMPKFCIQCVGEHVRIHTSPEQDSYIVNFKEDESLIFQSQVQTSHQTNWAEELISDLQRKINGLTVARENLSRIEELTKKRGIEALENFFTNLQNESKNKFELSKTAISLQIETLFTFIGMNVKKDENLHEFNSNEYNFCSNKENNINMNLMNQELQNEQNIKANQNIDILKELAYEECQRFSFFQKFIDSFIEQLKSFNLQKLPIPRNELIKKEDEIEEDSINNDDDFQSDFEIEQDKVLKPKINMNLLKMKSQTPVKQESLNESYNPESQSDSPQIKASIHSSPRVIQTRQKTAKAAKLNNLKDNETEKFRIQLVTPKNIFEEKLWLIERLEINNKVEESSTKSIFKISCYSTQNCNLEYSVNVRFAPKSVSFAFLQNCFISNHYLSQYPPNDPESEGYINWPKYYK